MPTYEGLRLKILKYWRVCLADWRRKQLSRWKEMSQIAGDKRFGHYPIGWFVVEREKYD